MLAQNSVRLQVWERGAGATLACGTGACAAVVAGVLSERLARECEVNLPGGKLTVHWDATNNRVYKTGPAIHVFTGSMTI